MVALLAALFASEKPLVTIDAFGLNHEHEILNLLPGNGTAECTEINLDDRYRDFQFKKKDLILTSTVRFYRAY